MKKLIVLSIWTIIMQACWCSEAPKPSPINYPSTSSIGDLPALVANIPDKTGHKKNTAKSSAQLKKNTRLQDAKITLASLCCCPCFTCIAYCHSCCHSE